MDPGSTSSPDSVNTVPEGVLNKKDVMDVSPNYYVTAPFNKLHSFWNSSSLNFWQRKSCMTGQGDQLSFWKALLIWYPGRYLIFYRRAVTENKLRSHWPLEVNEDEHEVTKMVWLCPKFIIVNEIYCFGSRRICECTSGFIFCRWRIDILNNQFCIKAKKKI